MPNYFSFSSIEFSSAIIVFNLFLAFGLGLAISFTYIKTHRGLSYSQSFLFTLVIISVLASVVMMVVQNNIIGAFALLGAFSLIRFRTIIKETKDVAYVFFSLAVGVAVGTNNYMIAVLTTAFLSLMIFVLTKYNFGSITRNGALITFTSNNSFSPDAYKNIFEDFLSSHKLLQVKALGEQAREYSFSIKLKNEKETDEFIKKFQTLPGIENIDLITGKTAVEY